MTRSRILVACALLGVGILSGIGTAGVSPAIAAGGTELGALPGGMSLGVPVIGDASIATQGVMLTAPRMDDFVAPASGEQVVLMGVDGVVPEEIVFGGSGDLWTAALYPVDAPEEGYGESGGGGYESISGVLAVTDAPYDDGDLGTASSEDTP